MSWVDDEISTWRLYESSSGREFVPVPPRRQVGRLLSEFHGDIQEARNSILWNIRADEGLSKSGITDVDDYWHLVLQYFDGLLAREVNKIMLEET